MFIFKKRKEVVGYTTGVFDLFHVGHLNLLRNAKGMCDRLIVGCSADEVVLKMKNKKPIIPFHERVEILEAIPYTNSVVRQGLEDYENKILAWEKYHFDIIFVGSDWQGTQKWNHLEQEFAGLGVKVVYFPYTKSTSSTKINSVLSQFRDNIQ